MPADPALELTVLMPCLNEARTLPACVGKALDFLQRAGIRGEVLDARQLQLTVAPHDDEEAARAEARRLKAEGARRAAAAAERAR